MGRGGPSLLFLLSGEGREAKEEAGNGAEDAQSTRFQYSKSCCAFLPLFFLNRQLSACVMPEGILAPPRACKRVEHCHRMTDCWLASRCAELWSLAAPCHPPARGPPLNHVIKGHATAEPLSDCVLDIRG